MRIAAASVHSNAASGRTTTTTTTIATKNTPILLVGASQGLGAALTFALAKKGHAVIAASRNRSRLESLAEDCNRAYPTDSSGGLVTPRFLDVTDKNSIAAMVDWIKSNYEGVHSLILNQGINHDACLAEWVDTVDFESVLSVNLVGSARILHACLPFLMDSKGTVVVLTSQAGVLGSVPGGVSNAASKAGLDAFFTSVTSELRALGVKTLIVEPGSFRADDETPRQVLSASGRYAQARTKRQLKPENSETGRIWFTWRIVTFVGLTVKLFAPRLFEQLSLRVRFAKTSPPSELNPDRSVV